jgi:hypothetical protein
MGEFWGHSLESVAKIPDKLKNYRVSQKTILLRFLAKIFQKIFFQNSYENAPYK